MTQIRQVRRLVVGGMEIRDPLGPRTESYEELPVASALVWRQREDTGHIIPIWRFFLLQNKNRIEETRRVTDENALEGIFHRF